MVPRDFECSIDLRRRALFLVSEDFRISPRVIISATPSP
ncbi:hypothetical protein STAFG_2403 [Streptomyces afghaniensis 772]|uniref:Uncharacterized protein n=1 Tax=Streptomyces afghaniensis 772 TaxID=1283301 RepID=S4N1G3_9ACTN|nr:hypothetical protein STAFG_2403 [Streptomyces afghaniensis 772]